MIVAGTGHRPNKLGGYDDETFARLVFTAKRALKVLGATHVVSGMALGWDMALAQAAYELNIPFTAAVPFKGQQSRWPLKSQLQFKQLLERASHVVIVCDGEYASWKMQKRNEWMVDNSTVMLALWNGDEKGGTYNCVRYAGKAGKTVANAWHMYTEGDEYLTMSTAEGDGKEPWQQETEERSNKPS